MIKNLAIIAPALPPTINGLGDYSLRIGEELKFNFNKIFYLSSEKRNNNQDYYFFNRSGTLLLEYIEKLKITHVLLNYSGYGYNVKGVPFWLIFAITKMRNRGIIVAVFFHEIFASGNFPKPAYWLSILQKVIFRNIYNASNIVFCSNSIVNQLVVTNTSDNGIKCFMIGMISNIPEPARFLKWSEKESHLVIFGTKGRRQLIYRNYSIWLPFLEANNISTIIDIGEDLDEVFPILKIPIQKKGILENHNIATLLNKSRFGMIFYPLHLLGKSGVFASYAAFGLVPLCLSNDRHKSTIDGVFANSHFVDLTIWKEKDQIDFSAISSNLNNWYNTNNSLMIHCKKISEVFNSI